MYAEDVDFRSSSPVDFGINLYFLRKEFGNTVVEIFDILEKRIVDLFETKKGSSLFDKFTLKEGWIDGLRKLYDATSWKPYRDLNGLKMPVFDVYTLVCKDKFMRITATPTQMSALIKTPEYVKLKKKEDEIDSQMRDAIKVNDSKKLTELMGRRGKIMTDLREMERTLSYGPKIERKTVLEPCYKIVSPPSLSVTKPPPEVEYRSRKQPYWHELESGCKSEVRQKLDALYNQLKGIMVTA